jgi:CDP-diacylglycerol--serine O-phosphatidyltransferase
MNAQRRGTIRRPNMRRAVILFPSGFTLGNLFFGIFAIIAASRLEFRTAGVYVMLGGICDALDGRVARATNSGTQFGEELDSLVDAITFGLAPGMIMYFAVLNRDGWDWIFVFLFAACAVLRLARFNIEQAGTAKTYFQGLPSPAAGITLASYYWFSQSWLYTYGAIGDLPWHVLLRFIMVALSILMISNVPYPSFPRTGFRSLRALGASLVVIGAIVLLATRKLEYFFPISLIYVSWGLVRWIFSGLFERRQPTVPYDLSEGEDEEDEEEFELSPTQVHATRAHRQEALVRPERPRGRGDRPARPERESRPAKSEAAPRADHVEKTDVAERAARPEKGERPQRTEAERAARREKREKRDKREGRPERGARPERGDRPAEVAAAMDVDAITVDETTPEILAPDEVIGRIPGGAEGEPIATTEGTPARKRKRRRRRGERKDRNGAPLPEDSAGGDDGDSDGGPDDGPAESESRSPYSTPAPIYAPAPAPTLAVPGANPPAASPPPAAPPAAAPPPTSPPSTPPSSEPHE